MSGPASIVAGSVAQNSLSLASTNQEAAGVSFMERLRRDHVLVHPYGEPTYWDERYENDKREHGREYGFDWYLKVSEGLHTRRKALAG